MSNMQENEKLSKTLFKKAIGYTVDEVVEEYVAESETEALKLVKKKVTKKHIPPDITAAKTWLESMAENPADKFGSMSDDELLALREEILAEISKGGKL